MKKRKDECRNNYFSSKFHFDSRDYFELDDAESEEVKQIPKVEI